MYKKKIQSVLVDCQHGIGGTLRVKPLTWGHGSNFGSPGIWVMTGTHGFQIAFIERVTEFPNFKAAYRDFTDKKYPMAFFSEKLKETKNKYSTYELNFMQWSKQFNIGSIIIVMESLFKEEILYI